MLAVEASSSVDAFTLKDWVTEQMVGLYSFMNKNGNFEETLRAISNELGMVTVDAL